MATVLITGGTGLIGTALTTALLEKNYGIIILTRGNEKKRLESDRVSYANWDTDRQTMDQEAVAKADYIVHLAGAGIADKRWTEKRKREIRDSRVKGAELLVKALQKNRGKVKAVITASAIGWYGEDPQIPNPRPFTEDDPADTGFLGKTCEEWENSLQPLQEFGVRVVRIRTGIVLSGKGGALEEFEKPLRFGVATILGSGRQVISWIHIDDLVRLYITAIEHDEMRGAFNAVAPQPVSNKTFVLEFARSKKGRFFIPVYVPSFVLRTVLGEMSIEVLKSATVSNNKVHFSGFTFLHPSVQSAFRALS